MSVATEITRLQNAKASIKTSIENKGVSVPSSALIDTYSTFIDAISGGGGGGLEYETGTYTPTADIARPTISFSGTHTNCPSFLTIYDCTETDYPDTNCNVGFTWVNMNRLLGSKYMYNSNTSVYRYITIQYIYRGTTLTSVSTGTQHIGYPDTDTHTNSSSYPRYWVSPTDFHPYTSSTTRYWRKDRNYKWIAIWK